MAWLTTLLIVVQVISAIAIIVLVLLQHGKGADMGAAFGGGASGSLFGATGSANFLSRSTGAVATVFFLATLGLAYTSTEVKRPADDRWCDGNGASSDSNDSGSRADAEGRPHAERTGTTERAGGNDSSRTGADSVNQGRAAETERYSEVRRARARQRITDCHHVQSFGFFHCRRGGIGRHTILRGWRRKP